MLALDGHLEADLGQVAGPAQLVVGVVGEVDELEASQLVADALIVVLALVSEHLGGDGPATGDRDPDSRRRRSVLADGHVHVQRQVRRVIAHAEVEGVLPGQRGVAGRRLQALVVGSGKPCGRHAG